MYPIFLKISSLLILYFILLPAGLGNHAPTDTIPIAAQLLSEYVQIASVSGNERKAGEYLAQLSRDHHLHVRVFTNDPDSYNFTASLYPLDQGKPNILLLNHIDVVPAGEDSLWTWPPFSGAIEDGFVWGRGSIDNKAMGIMQLLALASYVDLAAERDLPYNVTMLAVSGEEVGGAKGAKRMADDFLDDLHASVVYGEGGTGLRGVVQAKPDTPYFGIEIAQKTGLWFTIQASDPVSGHGSVPQHVYPAKEVAKAAASLLTARQPLIVTPAARQMLRHIGTHEKGLRKLALRNIRFFRHLIGNTLRGDPITNALLTNTITLTDLGNSAGAYNQVAHSAWATFDCRLLPGTSPEDFLKANRKYLGNMFDHIKIIGQASESGTSETGRYYDALDQAVMEVFEDAITGPIIFPAHNDNSFFREKGIPSYGLLPVILSLELVESIHNINERINIESLDHGIAIYQALIHHLLND